MTLPPSLQLFVLSLIRLPPHRPPFPLRQALPCLWSAWLNCKPTKNYDIFLVAILCFPYRYTANRQPGKALPYFLRLRRPNVFHLIREHNLFTDVQDQVLLLVEFDHELMEKRKSNGKEEHTAPSEAITLLVDNIHSIPVSPVYVNVENCRTDFASQITRVVQQLRARPYYLFLYLDALAGKDPYVVSTFADLQVRILMPVFL